jgi:hypothetical protein
MKKILFITAFPPNNKSGGQVFSLNLLRDLSTKYIVDMIYFSYRDHSIDPDIPVNSIKSFGINKFNFLYKITIYPLFTRRFNKRILAYIKNISSEYDIIFFDFSQVAIYSLYINHPYKIIRSHDIMFQKYSRKNRIFKYWVKSTERKIFQSVEKIFVLSEKDADIVKSIYNLDAYFTHEYVNCNFYFSKFIENDNIFIFFGLWSRKENLDGLIWFIKKVYPLIDNDLGIRFFIIGGGLSEKIKRKYLIHNNMEYLGFVDNPLDIIYRSQAVIAPLFTGAGVKVKVIDAFTTGTPVIGTNITFEGLPILENLTCFAHTPEEYAAIINNFPKMAYSEKQKNAEIFISLYDNNHLSEYL